MERQTSVLRVQCIMDDIECKRKNNDYLFNLYASEIKAINKAIAKGDGESAWAYVLGAKGFFDGLGMDIMLEARIYTNKAYHPDKNGNLHGVSHYNAKCECVKTCAFYESGAVKLEQYWDKGQRHGTCTEYYECGQIKSETNYKKGKGHGSYRHYRQNGNLHIIGSYKNGNHNGRQLAFDEDKRIVSISRYRNGIDDYERVSWGSDGRVSEVAKMRSGEYSHIKRDELGAGENPDMLDLLRFSYSKIY